MENREHSSGVVDAPVNVEWAVDAPVNVECVVDAPMNVEWAVEAPGECGVFSLMSIVYGRTEMTNCKAPRC